MLVHAIVLIYCTLYIVHVLPGDSKTLLLDQLQTSYTCNMGTLLAYQHAVWLVWVNNTAANYISLTLSKKISQNYKTTL